MMPQIISENIGLFSYFNNRTYDGNVPKRNNSDRCKSNQEYYELFLSSGEVIKPKNINIPDRTELRIIHKDGDFELGLLDLSSQDLVYFSSVMEVDLVIDTDAKTKKIRAVYQSLVWRLDKSKCPRTFVKDIMLKYLLNGRRSLLSDSYQTNKGMILWHNIINMAFDNDYMARVLTDCIRTTVTGVQADAFPVTANHLHQLKSEAWSADTLSDVRLLISKGAK